MQNSSKPYFSQVAREWDQLRRGYFSEELRSTAIAKAYLRPDMAVADIGGGTGFLSSELANQTRQVHLGDASAEMLSVARGNLGDFKNISIHQADGGNIPLPDNSMDAVFANMYLHHTPDPLKAIQEMVRILKPGGRLVITDLDVHTHEWMRVEMADEWMGFERNKIREWYRQAGLVNGLVTCSGQDCCSEPQSQTSSIEKVQISVFIAVGTKRSQMKKHVQQRYTLAAENGCGCGSQVSNNPVITRECCNPDPIITLDYQPQDLQIIPQEATEISLGCGNPLAIANLQPGEHVLDIGSGGGIDAFLAAKRVGPQGSVIGVDMTPAMLERATKTAQKHGYRQVEFRQGEAENLPVTDHSIDVVISNCVINLTEDKGKAFEEIARVLKPGGRLEISDTVTDGSLSEATRLNANEWAACVSGSLPKEEYLALIEQAGFVNLQTHSKPAYKSQNGEEIISLTVSAIKAN